MRNDSNAAATALRSVLGAWLVVLSVAFACGGLTKGPEVNLPPGTPIYGIPSDAGPDAGPDGGDAGPDAGLDGGPDAGCPSLSTAVIDGCFHTHALTLISSGCGSIPSSGFLLDNGAASCTGSLGSGDSFLGVCGSGSVGCTAPRMPGVISCNGGADAGGCNIVVCQPNGGSCP